MAHPWRQLRSRLRIAHRDDSPYLAEYTTTASTTNPDLKPFPGAILVHTATGADDHKVVTYWRSREHFHRDGDAFRQAIGGTTAWQGYVRDYGERRERLVRRIKWYTTLVTVIAVLGACENGRTWYNRFAAIPVLQASFDREGDTNVFAGDTIDETLRVANHLPTEQRVEILTATLAGGTDADQPVWDPPRIPELRENETVPIKVTTRAGVPGDYRLSVALHARAGRFRKPLDRTVDRQIVVWSREPRLASTTIARVAHDVCFIDCELRVGAAAPRGVSIDLRLARHPEVTDAVADIPGARVTHAWQPFGDTNASVSTATVRTPPLPAFHRLHFTLALTGDATTRWADVAAALKVTPTLVVPEGAP